MILTKEQISEKRNRSISLNKQEQKLLESRLNTHHDKWDYFSTKSVLNSPGQLFLYEQFLYDQHGELKITYPKIGIYIDLYSADQTVELEWVDHRRSWEYNVKYEYDYKDKTYTNIAADMRSEFRYMILWHDSMMVYGVWDKMPDWKQLRQCYEKTFWYWRDRDELRDIQIDRLLGGENSIL